MNAAKKKVWILIIAGLAVLAVSWFGWYSYELYQERLAVAERGVGEYIFVDNTSTENDLISFQGKQYERNPSVKAYLLIGVDTEGEMEQRVTGDGGQADGLFLVAYDAAGGSVKILMIPRDTMTPITLTDLSGNVLGKDIQHITLAYGYGDGRELSCERTAEAVSELLGGLKIDGYLAMNTSLIPELNDLTGGVTVHIETDELEGRDPKLAKGKDITLLGEQAETFIRYRDIEIDHSALTRMARQQQYIEAYFRAVRQQTAKDDQTIVRLMNMIEEHMITDLSKDQYLNIGKAILYGEETFGPNDILTIPGEGVVTDYFDEYHHDPEGTRQMVLDLFYREK